MTFIDSRRLPDDERIDRDLCIIGAGPAGIAVAREFLETGHRVALIESGDLFPDDGPQELAGGENTGLPYPELDQTRIRAFGGTTWHWGGNIRPLEPIDLAPRDWMPASGWPLTHEEISPYYERAKGFFLLPDTAFDEAHWRGVLRHAWDFPDGGALSQVFHTVGEPGLYSGITWSDAVEASENVDLFYHATTLEIVADEAARRIRFLRARTPDGKTIRFYGRHFVLAAGGIENPRILLLSSGQQAEGLGNEHGHVGRYFQEHLTTPDFGELAVGDPRLPLDFFLGTDREWGETWGVLRLSDETMRRHKLPNIRFQLATIVNSFNRSMDTDGMKSLRFLLGLTPVGGNKELGRHIANVIADIDHAADAVYNRLMYHPDYPLIAVSVVQIGEQVPNRGSLVRLSDKLDKYGQRRAVLHWRTTEQDDRGAWQSATLLRSVLEAADIGRLDIGITPDAFTQRPPKPHIHHMGTTRMSSRPEDGVVDPDCRVHRCDNLYVAGSSVFPTGGNCNPTFVLVSLAIRLADHLKQRLAA